MKIILFNNEKYNFQSKNQNQKNFNSINNESSMEIKQSEKDLDSLLGDINKKLIKGNFQDPNTKLNKIINPLLLALS